MRSATVVLPVPGLPVKLMCSVGASCARPSLLPRPLDEQQRGGLADALLDRREPDQLAVELFQHLGDAGFLQLLAQVDRSRSAARARAQSLFNDVGAGSVNQRSRRRKRGSGAPGGGGARRSPRA